MYSIANPTCAEASCYPSTGPGHKAVAYIHSHGAYSFGRYADNVFSPADKNYGDSYNIDALVVTPNGTIQRYSHTSYVISFISASGIPSDPNDPTTAITPPPVTPPIALPVVVHKTKRNYIHGEGHFVDSKPEGIIPTYETQQGATPDHSSNPLKGYNEHDRYYLGTIDDLRRDATSNPKSIDDFE